MTSNPFAPPTGPAEPVPQTEPAASGSSKKLVIIIGAGLALIGVPWVPFPFWVWLLGGLLGYGAIALSTLRDKKFYEQVVNKTFSEQFNVREIRSKELQSKVMKALEYRELMVKEIQRRDNPVLDELGNVNLNAIAEMEEADQRVAFLKAQEKDLLDAKAQLEHAITQLDQLSVTRFTETFEKVREHFRETFRRLFGGGRAEIVLENPDDVLESGIDIVARPPGKEPRTIGLLSGGEKTLTAVALLFAVFRAKPSPFAILDEVDAALDEANIRRLVTLLQEFVVQSQFLVVTHSKTTMEAANVLYGVTMEEPGVSKKVAVRLSDLDREPAEASAG